MSPELVRVVHDGIGLLAVLACGGLFVLGWEIGRWFFKLKKVEPVPTPPEPASLRLLPAAYFGLATIEEASIAKVGREKPNYLGFVRLKLRRDDGDALCFYTGLESQLASIFPMYGWNPCRLHTSLASLVGKRVRVEAIPKGTGECTFLVIEKIEPAWDTEPARTEAAHA